jgi:hypothetical protein
MSADDVTSLRAELARVTAERDEAREALARRKESHSDLAVILRDTQAERDRLAAEVRDLRGALEEIKLDGFHRASCTREKCYARCPIAHARAALATRTPGYTRDGAHVTVGEPSPLSPGFRSSHDARPEGAAEPKCPACGVAMPGLNPSPFGHAPGGCPAAHEGEGRRVAELPSPRLQIEWERSHVDEGPLPVWLAWYELLIPVDDARVAAAPKVRQRSADSGFGWHDGVNLHLRLGLTRVTGGFGPIGGNGAVEMPLRDGVHMCRDAEHLRLPAYAVWGSRATAVNAEPAPSPAGKGAL